MKSRSRGFIKSKNSAKKFTKKAKKRFADKYSSEERRPRRDSEERVGMGRKRKTKRRQRRKKKRRKRTRGKH